VRFPNKTFALVLLVAVAAPSAGARQSAQTTTGAASDRLRRLASEAQDKRGWPPLRQWAQTAPDGEASGQAYFVLGFREYEAGQYLQAAEDFEKAQRTSFSDYAEYYRGAALYVGNQPRAAADILDGFAARHPESVLRLVALTVLANASLAAGDPERALRALNAEPETRRRPTLDLLLAQAQRHAGNLSDAAQTYQEIYYTFPTSREAKTAGESLAALRASMGVTNAPSVNVELATARADTLLDHAQYREALKEYETLWKQDPASPFGPRWQVGQARCLLRLKRWAEAMNRLQAALPSDRAADASRLETLVEAYIQRDDRAAMDSILEQFRSNYFGSPSYAAALDAAGNHLVRQGDWSGAARYYRPLAELFPETQLGEEASWRVAWSHYLEKDWSRARDAFADNATRYPDSPHVAADFFWLGRLAEQSGATGEARAFYNQIEQRWSQTYYADAVRRGPLATRPASAVEGGGSPPEDPVADDLAKKVPPLPAPSGICEPLESVAALRPFFALEFLSLDELAEQYLRTLIRERSPSSTLLIALSRLEAEKGNYNPSLLEAAKALPSYSDYSFSELPGEIWSLLYPTAYWTVVEREARARGIDPYLVMALIRQESAFDATAVSPAKARGLMQLLVPTARTRKGGRGATARRLYDPVYNVRLGSDYLQHLLEMNQGIVEQTMAAYHAGEERVSAWLGERSFSDPAEFLESIPIPATRIYVEKVVRDAAIYRRLITGSPTFKKCS
jgi:soluble lytic murein transglycosylase